MAFVFHLQKYIRPRCKLKCNIFQIRQACIPSSCVKYLIYDFIVHSQGQLNHVYWIFGISTFATIGIIFFTFFTAPNAGEIAFIFAIVFVVSLVLLPFISATFYCFLRGNFVMPTYMRGKRSAPPTPQGVTEPSTITHQLNGKHHEEV